MSAGFQVDPEVLRRAGEGIGQAADQLDSVVNDFVSQLSSVGDPWGQDTLGTLIGGGYVAVEQIALETYTSVVDGLDGFADGLDDMAKQYSTHEAANVSDINSTGEGI